MTGRFRNSFAEVQVLSDEKQSDLKEKDPEDMISNYSYA